MESTWWPGGSVRWSWRSQMGLRAAVRSDVSVCLTPALQGEAGQSWFVVCATFHGVNTPVLAHYKLNDVMTSPNPELGRDVCDQLSWVTHTRSSNEMPLHTSHQQSTKPDNTEGLIWTCINGGGSGNWFNHCGEQGGIIWWDACRLQSKNVYDFLPGDE